MPIQDQYLLLLTKIEQKIEKYKRNKNINRNWAFGFYLLVAILTACTTLLSGSVEFIEKHMDIDTNFAILCLSSSLFLINTVVAFFNNREGYTVYRKALNQMRRLKTKLELIQTKESYTEQTLAPIRQEYFQIVQFVDDSQLEIRGNESDV